MQFANFAERIKGMILYFSATGNSHYVAQKIAEATGDKIISIETLVKEKRFELSTNEDEALGIVTPTYFWGLPHIVEEFLAHLNIRLASGCYVYLVATYGTTTGAIGKISRCILSRKLYLFKELSPVNIGFWPEMTMKGEDSFIFPETLLSAIRLI